MTVSFHCNEGDTMRVILRGVATMALICFATLAQAAPGEYWESTTKMDMAGMPFAMPDQTTRICVPKGREKDPAASVGKDCDVLESNVTSNRATFKVRCNKDGDVMTGTGDISFSPDRTEGRMAFTSKHGDMKVNFVNKRVGGACDSDEQRKKYEATANQMQQQICTSVDLSSDVIVTTPELFTAKDAPCAAKRDALCAAVLRTGGTPVGYQAYKTTYSNMPKACGIPIDTLRRNLCKAMNGNNAEFVKSMRDPRIDRNALKAECPAEYKVYAETMRKRYCEGRDFTAQQQVSLADCLAGKGGDGEDDISPAGKRDAGTAAIGVIPTKKNVPPPANDKPADPPASSNPAADLIDGAKKLKGMFGF